MKMECDCLNGLKNGHMHKNLTQMVNLRDIAGEPRSSEVVEEEEEELEYFLSTV